MKQRVLDALAVVLIATLFLSFVAFMSVQTYRSGALLYERFWSSQHWDQVQGKITEVQTYRGCGRGGRGFGLDLKYEYQIGTNTYTSDAIFIGPSKCYSQAKLDQLKRRFPIASTVPVYVDPHHPINAVLIRELGRGSIMFIFVIELALLLVTLIPIRFALRAWRDNQHQTQRLADVLLRRSEIDRSIRVAVKK